MQYIQHKCKPGIWCGQCSNNVQLGFPPNHPGNEIEPPSKRAKKSETCAHLGKATRVAGSGRVFRLCMAGVAPEVGGVSACVSCNKQTGGEFRIGYECGPGCSSFAIG
jgi:hypothetical protein